MMEEISHFLNSVCVVLFNLIPLVDEATYALPTVNEKSAQRDAKTAHALAVVRFGHCPPATNTQDRLQYTAPLTSAQCNYIYFASVLVCNGDAAEYFLVSGIVCTL